MYAIHTTPGFIIESRPAGEAGRLLSIFTRDLGLVWATAQGIRLEKSKLRYHCQEYSLGEFSFVRGKEFWRLTSADQGQSKNAKKQRGKDSQELVARIALLLRRLLQGEEMHPELFGHIAESFNFIEEHSTLSSEQFKTLESIVVFRILYSLGYIGTDKGLNGELISGELSIGLIDSATGQRMDMNKHINKALKESHL